MMRSQWCRETTLHEGHCWDHGELGRVAPLCQWTRFLSWDRKGIGGPFSGCLPRPQTPNPNACPTPFTVQGLVPSPRMCPAPKPSSINYPSISRSSGWGRVGCPKHAGQQDPLFPLYFPSLLHGPFSSATLVLCPHFCPLLSTWLRVGNLLSGRDHHPGQDA